MLLIVSCAISGVHALAPLDLPLPSPNFTGTSDIAIIQTTPIYAIYLTLCGVSNWCNYSESVIYIKIFLKGFSLSDPDLIIFEVTQFWKQILPSESMWKGKQKTYKSQADQMLCYCHFYCPLKFLKCENFRGGGMRSLLCFLLFFLLKMLGAPLDSPAVESQDKYIKLSSNLFCLKLYNETWRREE